MSDPITRQQLKKLTWNELDTIQRWCEDLKSTARGPRVHRIDGTENARQRKDAPWSDGERDQFFAFVTENALTARDTGAAAAFKQLQFLENELALLKTAPPAEGPKWQPIETHDGSGTPVLLWWPFWCKSRAIVGAFGYKGIQQWMAAEALEGDGDPPTHWMPLPTPPRDPAGKE